MDKSVHRPRGLDSWNDFWFAPRNPSVLALMRILCGAVTLYTIVVYSFSLQDFMGKNGWIPLEDRLLFVREKPVYASPLTGQEWTVALPRSQEEEQYYKAYMKKWRSKPPAPFPTTKRQEEFIDEYIATYRNDPRMFGLRPPATAAEEDYIIRYTNHPANTGRVPPPAYPKDPEEENKVYEYMERNAGVDYRRMYALGSPIWSLWFHVTDPTWMAIWHAIICLIVFLFMIGFCTRVTSALTWIAALWYIHRNTVVLFGVDTMMGILLLYLAIGNSGGAFSVDRLIARWWSQNKLRVINHWRAFWRKPPLEANQIVPAAYSPTPVPTVSTNVAIRLMQVHVCIIYLAAGLTKLQGAAWWNGTAVWSTFANFEFAPMQFEVYNWLLRRLGSNEWMFQLFLNSSALFTLVFEIGYPFLIWRPSTRWLFLSGAIILHGFIGLFMGLKTFSLMMLVMNMCFLKTEEAYWFLGIFGVGRSDEKPPSAPPREIEPEAEGAWPPVAVATGAPANVSTAIQEKGGAGL